MPRSADLPIHRRAGPGHQLTRHDQATPTEARYSTASGAQPVH